MRTRQPWHEVGHLWAVGTLCVLLAGAFVWLAILQYLVDPRRPSERLFVDISAQIARELLGERCASRFLLTDSAEATALARAQWIAAAAHKHGNVFHEAVRSASFASGQAAHGWTIRSPEDVPEKVWRLAYIFADSDAVASFEAEFSRCGALVGYRLYDDPKVTRRTSGRPDQ